MSLWSRIKAYFKKKDYGPAYDDYGYRLPPDPKGYTISEDLARELSGVHTDQELLEWIKRKKQ